MFEIAYIIDLFDSAKNGLFFYGEAKKLAVERLKNLTNLSHFDQLITLLQVFKMLAVMDDHSALNKRPIANAPELNE